MDFLSQIEKQLDMTVEDKAEVMRELTAHFDELCAEFAASGMDAAQAQTEAEAHMGSPADIAARLNAAHNSASWKSALLCVVPFGLSAIYLVIAGRDVTSRINTIALAGIGLVMLAASAWQLILGRRPLWLATWLAAGLLCVPGVLYSLGATVPSEEGSRAAGIAMLALSTFVLVAAAATRRLLKPVLVVEAVALPSAACLAFTNWLHSPAMAVSAATALLGLTGLFSAVVLLVLFAHIVFRTHTYGNALQAVLFLLGVWVIRFSPPSSSSAATGQTIEVVLSAIAAVWFMRSPKRGTKGLACYCALFVYALTGQYLAIVQPWADKIATALLSSAVTAFLYYMIVVSPLYPVIRREVDRLRVAR